MQPANVPSGQITLRFAEAARKSADSSAPSAEESALCAQGALQPAGPARTLRPAAHVYARLNRRAKGAVRERSRPRCSAAGWGRGGRRRCLLASAIIKLYADGVGGRAKHNKRAGARPRGGCTPDR